MALEADRVRPTFSDLLVNEVDRQDKVIEIAAKHKARIQYDTYDAPRDILLARPESMTLLIGANLILNKLINRRTNLIYKLALVNLDLERIKEVYVRPNSQQ